MGIDMYCSKPYNLVQIDVSEYYLLGKPASAHGKAQNCRNVTVHAFFRRCASTSITSPSLLLVDVDPSNSGSALGIGMFRHHSHVPVAASPGTGSGPLVGIQRVYELVHNR